MWRKAWNIRVRRKRYPTGDMPTTYGKRFRSPVTTGQALVKTQRFNHR